MRAWLTAKLRGGLRCPLAGVALAAMLGIGLAEGWRVRCIPGPDAAAAAQWIALAVFLLLAGTWTRRRRVGWLWGAVAAGYAALHLFASDPLPAATLAHVLASPVGAVATGNDPSPGPAHVLHATGIVLDVPRLVPPPPGVPGRPPAGPTWHCTLRLDDAEVDGLRWPCHAAVALQWRDAGSALSPGDRLEMTALAQNVLPPRNPGEFDRAAHLRRQGILSAVRVVGVADARILPPPPGVPRLFSPAPFRRFAGRVHGWMERTLRRDLDDDPAAVAIVSTTLLGLSNPPGLGDLENVFQRTGTLHYFAVDGLKLGLVAFLLLRTLIWLGLPRPFPGLLVLPLLLVYAFATGLSVASARAVTLAAVVVGGELVDRPVQPINSLGAAASGVLLFNPQGLFDLSFQLTFSVMFAILLLARPLDERLRRVGAPDPFLPHSQFSRTLRGWEWLRGRICGLTALSVASWLGSLPIMLVTFHLFSPVSLVANVVTFPLAFAVLALGVLSLTVSGFSTPLAVWFNNTNSLAAKSFLFLVRAFDALPGGSFAVASPSNWHWPVPAAALVVYDFDRGRAASLRAGRAEWLFDAARLSEYSQGILPCLRARAVEGLDGGLLLTQGDADHLAAARLAVTDLHPARIVESAVSNRSPLRRDFHQFLVVGRHPEILCHSGDLIPLGEGSQARVLYPPDDLSGRFRAAADRALVLQIEASGWRILMLTEGSGAAAQWLTSHASSSTLPSAVLVTSGPIAPDLLAAVRPRLVVVRPPIIKETTIGKPAPPSDTAPIPATIPTLNQRDTGAVTLLIYPDHLQATGCMDGRQVLLKK